MSKRLELSDVGVETAFEGFARDALALARVAASQGFLAIGRLWRRPTEVVSLGRYHRLDPRRPRLERRLSGGRAVVLGPGTLGFTLVVPNAAWLDPRTPDIGPAQILNRALRPILALLRDLGVDAYYPGRDLLTAGGRPIAHASFAPMPDGVLVVEQHLAWQSPLCGDQTVLARYDPEGVAASDVRPLAGSVPVAQLAGAAGPSRLLEPLAERCEARFQCDTIVAPADPVPDPPPEAAYAAFCGERGPLGQRTTTAVGFGSLGLVEVSAGVENGRLDRVEICGDLIAPFETVDRLEARLAGLTATKEAAEEALAEVCTGGFMFGAECLPELVARLA